MFRLLRAVNSCEYPPNPAEWSNYVIEMGMPSSPFSPLLLYLLSTHPLNPPTQRTLSIHQLNPSIQPALCTSVSLPLSSGMVRESQRLAPAGGASGGDARLRRVEQLDMASNRVIQVFAGVNAASRTTGITLYNIEKVRLYFPSPSLTLLQSM